MNETQHTNTAAGPREMNWKLLRPYERGLQVAGWLAMVLFVVACGGTFHFYLFVSGGSGPKSVPQMTPLSVDVSSLCREQLYYVREYLLPGFVLFTLAQLIGFLAKKECSPGALLRHGHWVLFLYGMLFLVDLSQRGTRLASSHDVILFATYTGPPIVAKALFVFGAALILRRLVLIIEESKTLV